MRFGTVILLALCLGLLCLALPVGATTVTSSFVNFVYTYNVTPAPGEAVRDFHVYAGVGEGNLVEYMNVQMPPGWQFTVIQLPTKVVITWWTTGAPLPVGAPALFSYLHYCAPCCHSWFTTGTGSPGPDDPSIDGSWNHPNDVCNIPPPFDVGCAGHGGVVAPIYPDPTPAFNSTWGRVKAFYR